ncbi:TlpA disulfide reductase family protein [Lachnospiraceae bacterium 38-10]
MKTKNTIFSLSMVLLLNALLLTACGGTGENADRQNTPETEKTASSEQSAEDDSVSYLPLSVGDAAPDFTAVLTDGTEFTLSEQQGKVVLLNFWATWCGPCVREMPAFEKLYGEYGEDVAILAVNCMESEDIVKAFQDENGYTFPIACDPEGDVSLKYPSQGIPYTLVIDEEGIIQNIYVGAADAETQYLEYKGAIDAVSEGK